MEIKPMEEEIKIQNPKSLVYRVMLRLVRIFVAGGLAGTTGVIICGLDLASLKTWLIALLVAFLTGGLAAIDKAIRG